MNSAGNIDFENRLQSWIDSINAEIKKSLDDILPHAPGREHPFIGRVYDHIYEYLENGGKRMHGISILLSYRVAGGNNLDMILPVAAAFQLYHHHTLIHDDIYDEDMKRRGFATAHHAFSNYFLRKHGTANGDAASAVFNSPSRRKGVIAGFALGKIVHAIAFELIAKAGIPAEALHILRKINLHDLADNAAQLKDVYHEGSSITSPEESLRIAYEKTGMLFQAGTECAALLAGCSPATTDSIKDWILCSAMAYQLKDDLEDFAADSEKGMGRGVGTDLKTKKPTFILATAMNRASAADRSIMQSWLYAHDSGIGPDTIMRILDETSALSVCSGKINELIAEADAALRGSAAISEEDRQELMSFSKYFISDSYWKRALPQPAA